MNFLPLFLLAAFLQLGASFYGHANCGDMTLPFEEKVKMADWIFTGVAIEDKVEKTESNWLDASVIIKVKKVFKGSPGKKIKVYYHGHTSGHDCEPKRAGAFVSKRGEKFERLFYTTFYEGKPFTSTELEGGHVKLGLVPKELRELSSKFSEKKK